MSQQDNDTTLNTD
ncbi:MAG: hypothetical protein EZS28_031731, partial [Streblomastix strix]